MESLKEIKMCVRCVSVEIPTNSRKKYCEDCRIANAKDLRDKNSKEISRKKRLELDNNFYEVNPSGLSLIPSRFNKISHIKYQNYNNHFRIPWVKILERYEKSEELKIALIEEYKVFYKETGNQGIDRFIKYMSISQDLMSSFEHAEFREAIGVNYNRNQDEDYSNNFFEIIDKLGRVPYTLKEFRIHSKISFTSYVKHLKLNSENQLLKIIEKYGEGHHIKDFVEGNSTVYLESRKKAGEKLKGVHKHSTDFLIDESKKLINSYLEEFGMLPSKFDFDRISEFSYQSLIIRFNKSYNQILKDWGYDINLFGSNAEKLVIENISKILNSEYKPQATFTWLKGIKNWALKCDAYFIEYNLIVEFDGIQHDKAIEFWGGEEAFEITQANDHIKNTLIPQQGIKLIRVKYNEPYWDEDFLRMRLIENNILPSNHELVEDSALALSL